MTENETVSERDRALGAVVAAHVLRRSGQSRRADRLERQIGDAAAARDAAQHMAAALVQQGHSESAAEFAERAEAFRQDPARAGDRSTPPPRIAGGAPAPQQDATTEGALPEDDEEALQRLAAAVYPAFNVDPAGWGRLADAVRRNVPGHPGAAQQAYSAVALGLEEAADLYSTSEEPGERLRARGIFEHALYGGRVGAQRRFTAQPTQGEDLAARYAEAARLLQRHLDAASEWRMLASYIEAIPTASRQGRVILAQVAERVRYAQSLPEEQGRAIYDGAIGFVEMAARHAQPATGN